MPMQPKPWAETLRPWEPSLRRGMDMERLLAVQGRRRDARRDSECERAARLEQVGELLSGERLAEQVTLDAVTTVGTEELALARGLHALGDDHDLQVAGHADDGGDDGSIVHVEVDVAHEGLVDLEFVQVKPA